MQIRINTLNDTFMCAAMLNEDKIDCNSHWMVFIDFFT